MRLIGNILWFVLGGFVMGVAWFLFGILAFMTIVGIPWGRSCFTIGIFSFFPFGKEAISRKAFSGRDDVGTGGFGMIGNIIWFILAGIWLAIGHILASIACFITIIGIPFGIQHLKLAGVSLFPVGQTVVTKEVARAALQESAQNIVSEKRSS